MIFSVGIVIRNFPHPTQTFTRKNLLKIIVSRRFHYDLMI